MFSFGIFFAIQSRVRVVEQTILLFSFPVRGQNPFALPVLFTTGRLRGCFIGENINYDFTQTIVKYSLKEKSLFLRSKNPVYILFATKESV